MSQKRFTNIWQMCRGNDLGTLPKKKRDFLGIFPKGVGGLLNSQNFCKLTKLFLVCQNHSYVPKHVLQ